MFPKFFVDLIFIFHFFIWRRLSACASRIRRGIRGSRQGGWEASKPDQVSSCSMHPESLQTSDLGAFFVWDNNFSWGLESSGGGSEPGEGFPPSLPLYLKSLSPSSLIWCAFWQEDINNLCNFFCALWNPVGESAGEPIPFFAP